VDPHDGAVNLGDAWALCQGVKSSRGGATRQGWFVVLLAAALLVPSAAEPAHATFPGANGLIAFVRPDFGGEIYTINPNGTDIRQLTHLAPHHLAQWPAWSPDGSQIVFERVNARRQNNHIWIMDADGSNLRHLFPDPWFTDHTPSFSPDGTKVLFSRCQDDPPPADQGRCAVATIDLDGTGMVQLTVPIAEEQAYWPRYSPDGTQIAFSVVYGRGVGAGILVMNADGSNVELVPKLRVGIPDWAPDGSRLVFTTHPFSDLKAIWAVNPDGTGLVQLTAPGERHDSQPVNAPDGSRIVFERYNADYSKHWLYTMDPDGTEITRVIRDASNPAWQPLGSAVNVG
jgi:Tol biopolymer transport system component